jgi:hypothetical protein
MRRGTFARGLCGSRGQKGEVLHSGRLGPCSPALSSNTHCRKRCVGLGVARKRRQGRTVVSGSASCNVLAALCDRRRKGCRGSRHSSPLLREGKAEAG